MHSVKSKQLSWGLFFNNIVKNQRNSKEIQDCIVISVKKGTYMLLLQMKMIYLCTQYVIGYYNSYYNQPVVCSTNFFTVYSCVRMNCVYSIQLYYSGNTQNS